MVLTNPAVSWAQGLLGQGTYPGGTSDFPSCGWHEKVQPTDSEKSPDLGTLALCSKRLPNFSKPFAMILS